MLYLYLFLPIGLLAVLTIYYLRSLKSSAVAANTQLFIDAWNASERKQNAQTAVTEQAKKKQPATKVPA